MDDNERWAPIPGWKKLYDISTLGRVYRKPGKYVPKGRMLRGSPDRDGYTRVNLSKHVRDHATGKRRRVCKTKYMHRLVFLTFVGPIKKSQEINHKDNRRDNPRLDNLAAMSHAENIAQAVAIGDLDFGGEKNPFSKLQAQEVIAIRMRRAEGANTVVLAKEYGVSVSTIKDIVHGRTWNKPEYFPR